MLDFSDGTRTEVSICFNLLSLCSNSVRICAIKACFICSCKLGLSNVVRPIFKLLSCERVGRVLYHLLAELHEPRSSHVSRVGKVLFSILSLASPLVSPIFIWNHRVPTDLFSTLELDNQPHDVLELNGIRRYADLEALKL